MATLPRVLFVLVSMEPSTSDIYLESDVSAPLYLNSDNLKDYPPEFTAGLVKNKEETLGLPEIKIYYYLIAIKTV